MMRVKMLSSCMSRGANNYDLLRLLLALIVIIGHASVFQPGHGYVDPVEALIHFDYSGGVAVMVFFFLSGLFVADSMIARASLTQFVTMRAARILPGLFVCLLVCVFVVGPAFTEMRIGEYLRDPLTLSFLDRNLLLTNLQWRLPGVFADSRYGLNGSLSTLPIEIRLYGLIVFVQLLGAFRLKSSATLAIALAAYVALAYAVPVPDGGQDVSRLTLAFLCGMIAAVHKDRVPVHWAIAILLWAVVAVAWQLGWERPAVYGAIFYTVVVVFQMRPLVRLRLPGDFSYGVYIYGFVVQQVFASLFPQAHPLANAATCMSASLAVASLSWFFVEKPSLAAAHRFLRAVGDGAGVRRLAPSLAVPAMAVLAVHGIMLVPGYGSIKAALSDLRVTAYGPLPITHAVPFNVQPYGGSAIWMKLSRPVRQDAQIRIGNVLLASTVSDNLITARVPRWIFAEPATLSVDVLELIHGRPAASAPVPLEIR